MQIKLYFEEGTGADQIRGLMTDWVTSTAARLGVNQDFISHVGLAYPETYCEAINDLMGESDYTNNIAHVAVGKSQTTFDGETPQHRILFHACVLEMIMSGIIESDSHQIADWKAESQLGIFIIAHELGHCRDNELHHWAPTELLSFNKGFDLNKVNKYYFDIMVGEIGACLYADRFYSNELLKYTFNNDCQSIEKHRLELETAKTHDQINRIFRVATIGSALNWVYLIQLAKIIVCKSGTPFEAVQLNHPFGGLTGMESLHPKIEEAVSTFISTYPNGLDIFQKEIEHIWANMCTVIQVEFIENNDGWECYWN